MIDEIQNLVATVHHETQMQQSSVLKNLRQQQQATDTSPNAPRSRNRFLPTGWRNKCYCILLACCFDAKCWAQQPHGPDSVRGRLDVVDVRGFDRCLGHRQSEPETINFDGSLCKQYLLRTGRRRTALWRSRQQRHVGPCYCVHLCGLHFLRHVTPLNPTQIPSRNQLPKDAKHWYLIRDNSELGLCHTWWSWSRPPPLKTSTGSITCSMLFSTSASFRLSAVSMSRLPISLWNRSIVCS